METQDRLREQVVALARALKVVGLMNTQFAIQQEADGSDTIFLLEVNPRASRTVPFVSKAIGLPLAKIAARCMAGKTLAEQGATKEIVPDYYSVKEAIFPFAKFQGVDPILGPEMRSTGEVMGVGRNFGAAMARAHEAGGIRPLPASGKVFVSVRDPDKSRLLPVAQELVARGYRVVATQGTGAFLRENGVDCEFVKKVIEGRPHVVDLIKNGEIVYIVNTTEGRQAIADSYSIRREALQHRVTYSTTIAGARALLLSLEYRGTGPVWSLQELHATIGTA
jgi:carbamoyl-phosphate synthase large subunit